LYLEEGIRPDCDADRVVLLSELQKLSSGAILNCKGRKLILDGIYNKP
jgi:hypothetical protein